jgi:hypothetical protein
MEEAIDVSINDVNLESIQILLQFLFAKNVSIYQSRLISVCKLASLKLTSTENKLDLKLNLFKLIFGKFNLNITTKIKFTNSYSNSNSINESLFSVCFEFTCTEICRELIDSLKRHETSRYKVQEILIETFMNKIKRSFECNVKLIEILLQHINNKKQLYNRLVRYDKGRLLKPSENHLKSSKLLPPKETGFSRHILNSYFIKQQMLVKYDIIPISKRIFWLANYIYYWTVMCYNRSAYISASSILRFISIDELVDLVTNYFRYLIESGLVNVKKKSSILWWFNLKNRSRMSMLSSQDKNRLESGILNLYETNRRMPYSLKMIARNRVRFSLLSLSNESLSYLKLPNHLVNFIKNDESA